jgi:cell division septation protein DedD
MVRSGFAALGFVVSLWAAPAFADVKAGVDAWSRGDYTTAIKEWRQPAISGDADAQFNLGQAYKLGRGVPVDLKLAEDWYRKAALQGHLQAEDNYGLILFQNGDRQKALPHIQKSANRGEPRAQYILGTALFNGDMVKKDWTRAYALMTRASAAGLAPASASLAEMDRYIPIEQRQKGLVLSRELEQQASRPMLPLEPVAKVPARPTPKPAPVIREAALPPSKPAPKVAVVTPKPVTKPVAVVATPKPGKPAAAPSGNWRVQLGAFSDQAKASALWAKLKATSGLSGLQPSFVKAGAIIRLQSGPIASKAAAEKVCASVKAAGQACFPVAP